MGLAFDTRRGTDELLERDEALAMLTEALNDARLGHGRVVLVGGEAGAGKTTLVRTFCARVERHTRVLVGACDALSTPRPLGPLLDVARECDALADALHVAVQPSEVFTVLRDELSEQPTVLVIEDLHWGDEATFDVLRLLARRMDMPALVVATYRDDGLHRDHPMRVLLGDLATAAIGRVALEPLSPAAVAQLAAGHDVDAADLHARTAGNPFFVTQVLAAGGDGVPPTVRDAVLARTSALSGAELEVLETVSLALPSAEPWLLEAVLHEGADRVDACIATGLVSADGATVAFRHELARSAVEDATPPPRRLGLQRRILRALTTRDEGEIDPARLAHHAEAAGDVEAVLVFAPAAAARAVTTGAYREAAAQYARALRLGGQALSPARRAELLEARSRACYLADDQLEAMAVIREAIACRREEVAPSHEARDLTELASYLVCRGLLKEAREATAEATRLIAGEDESAEVGFVQASYAYQHLVDGDLAAALDLGRSARETARRHGDSSTAVDALITVGAVELSRDAQVGREIMHDAIAEARSAGHPEQVARALNSLGWFGVHAPAPEFADTYLPQALEYCTAHSEDLWRINALALAARNALDRGRWTDAADLAARLLQDPRESPWPHHEALVVLALVRARRGDPGASAALDEAQAVGVPPDEVDVHLDFAAARAEVAWIEHHADGVARATDAMLHVARECGAGAAAARLSFWRLLAGLEIEQAGANGPYALAVAGKWERAADEWTRMSFPYEAALALIATNDEEPLRRALEKLQELRALPASQLAMRRLRALGARGLARGPRRATRENAAGLTPRESEVLALVAAGHRNAQIADQLFLSRRTVDHHISALLRKLEAGSRMEAVASAQRLGLLQDR
jgi:DNA-binding CsgD family transcriptional regulator